MSFKMLRVFLLVLVSAGCGVAPDESSPQLQVSEQRVTEGSGAVASSCHARSNGGRAYLFCTNRKTWAAAQEDCAASGYNLASIDDANENAWVVDTSLSIEPSPDFVTGSWWIGANDIQQEGVWRSVSGEPAPFTLFAPAEPNGGRGENCIHLRRYAHLPYTWNDAACSGWLFNYVCESQACPPESLGAPTLLLNGAAEMTLECGQGAYVDPGATAADGCGFPLEVHRYNSGQDAYGPGPDTSAEGTYSVQYIAWDASGATVSAIRTVHVDDRTAPTLQLKGPQHMTHVCGSGWVDPGVEATDACYGDVTPTVTTGGYVNGWVEGLYTVTYGLTDSGGNSAPPVTRTVEVVDCPW